MYKKHILFIFRTLGTGGSQKVQAFVANTCAKNGYKVSILSMSEEENSLTLNKNIEVITLNYDKVKSNKDNFFSYFLKRLFYLKKFREKCKEINPDLICVFLIDIVRLTVIALSGLNYPILASERADPSQFPSKKIKQYNRAINKCVGIVFQLQEASMYYDIKTNIYQEVIPNPSILRNIGKEKNGKKSEDLFIFGAGRLTHQKRFDLLIDAFSIVNISHPEYRLKIYGDGIERKNLESKVIKMKLTDKIDFMGDVKDIFKDVNNNSIFVLTSDFEGIPNVLTESLIKEIPCISTDCSPGGARLLLNEGECGDIVERGNYREIASSIMKYIENPDYTRSKVLLGREYVKKFKPKIIEEKWLNLFERIFEDV